MSNIMKKNKLNNEENSFQGFDFLSILDEQFSIDDFDRAIQSGKEESNAIISKARTAIKNAYDSSEESFHYEVNNIINMRLSGQIKNNSMKNYSVELEGSAYSSMGARTAAKIDAALGKIGSDAGYDISRQEKEETRKKLVFKMQF